jgi:hypothetical protein
VGTPWQRRGIATEAAQGLVARLSEQPVQTIIDHVPTFREAKVYQVKKPCTRVTGR